MQGNTVGWKQLVKMAPVFRQKTSSVKKANLNVFKHEFCIKWLKEDKRNDCAESDPPVLLKLETGARTNLDLLLSQTVFSITSVIHVGNIPVTFMPHSY